MEKLKEEDILHPDYRMLNMKCPKGNNPGVCRQEPCDRRPLCRKEGIINEHFDWSKPLCSYDLGQVFGSTGEE